MEKYNFWSAHNDKTPPELPAPIAEDKWARLDMRRRTEYEFTVQEARETRARHENIGTQLKQNAVYLLENFMKKTDEWTGLAEPLLLDDDSEEAKEESDREKDLNFIRSHYLFLVTHALINIHKGSNDDLAVLNVARIIVDPKYDIHTVSCNPVNTILWV